MSGSTTPAKYKVRKRWLRDSNGRVIEIRAFDIKARVGDHCQTVRIIRDSSTQQIIGQVSSFDKVTQDDLNATS